MDLRDALQTGPVLLDGGLATTLEAAGHPLGTALWSARLLVEEPAAVTAVHTAFLDAGAQVLVTASYQASIEGLTGTGLTAAEAAAAIRRSVECGREAIQRWRTRTGAEDTRWVAGSVGPYGASLADGSEYTGAYDLDATALREFHAPRIEQLVAADADVLAIETQPRLDEALVALALARSHGMDAWVSFTTRDGALLPDGTPLEAAAEEVAGAGAFAVGVNCCTPEAARRAIDTIADTLPGDGPATVAYPNLGDRWDPARGAWVARDERSVPPLPAADLVGGCCGTSPQHIAALSERLATAT